MRDIIPIFLLFRILPNPTQLSSSFSALYFSSLQLSLAGFVIIVVFVFVFGVPVQVSTPPPPPSAPSRSAGDGSWGGKLWRRQVLAPLQSFVCSPPQLRSSVYLRTNTPLSCSTEERPHVKFRTRRRKGRSVTIHKLPVSKALVNLVVEELVK